MVSKFVILHFKGVNNVYAFFQLGNCPVTKFGLQLASKCLLQACNQSFSFALLTSI